MIGEEVNTPKGRALVVGTHEYNGSKSVIVQGVDSDFYERIAVSELHDGVEPAKAEPKADAGS